MTSHCGIALLVPAPPIGTIRDAPAGGPNHSLTSSAATRTASGLDEKQKGTGETMRMSDLSQRSGVPVATIKFYLREGLLPAGAKTAPNRATYGEEHLARLRLARALITVGRLSVSSVRTVIGAVDDATVPTQLRRIVDRALPGLPPSSADIGDIDAGRAAADKLLEMLGWSVPDGCPGRVALAQALAALWHLGWQGDVDALLPYAELAERLAVHNSSLPAAAGEEMVARTVLFDVALMALSRMAHEHHPVPDHAAGGDRGDDGYDGDDGD